MDVSARHDGDLVVTHEQVIRGRVDGSIRVVGGHLTLADGARVTGNVVVDTGTAIVVGQVDGDVTNIDGTVSVHGRVRGGVRGPSEATSVAADAVVGPQPGDERLSSGSVGPDIVFVPTKVDTVVQRVSRPSDRLQSVRRWWSWRSAQYRFLWKVVGLAVMVVGVAVVLGLLGFALLGDDEPARPQNQVSSPTSTGPTSTGAVAATAVPNDQAAAPTDSAAVALSRERLAALTVVPAYAPEAEFDPAAYSDAALFGGCEPSSQVLLARESTVEVTRSLDGCAVVGGAWTDQWTGVEVTDGTLLAADLGISAEHAHAAGGWQWSAEDRLRYANDLRNAFVVARDTIEDRGIGGPETWQPPLASQHCLYAAAWIRLKDTWALATTPEEVAALGSMLDTCGAAEPLPDWIAE